MLTLSIETMTTQKYHQTCSLLVFLDIYRNPWVVIQPNKFVFRWNWYLQKFPFPPNLINPFFPPFFSLILIYNSFFIIHLAYKIRLIHLKLISGDFLLRFEIKSSLFLIYMARRISSDKKLLDFVPWMPPLFNFALIKQILNKIGVKRYYG